MSRYRDRLGWVAFLVVWVTLPFTAGPALAAALSPSSAPVRDLCSVALWVLWAAVVGAALVPRTVTLTAVRIVVPASVVAALWALVTTTTPDWRDALALSCTALATVAVLAPITGEWFVNGSSYGDERRLPLRVPGLLLLGPIELAWAAVVAGVVAGPLLLASRLWLIGGVVLVVGWAVTVVGVRALHTLARRWVVFVPAGMVVVDPLTLADALLAQRSVVAALGPAPADSDARDLTAYALGLALELTFTEPQTIVPAPRRRLRGEQPAVSTEDVAHVLFAPTRPGAVLAEAARRRLPVG